MTNIISLFPQNILKELNYQKNSIISKVLLKTTNLNLTLFAAAKNQEFLPHTSTREALVHILEGEGEFMLDNEWHKFKSNDYFFMPQNKLHAIRAKSDFKFLLYLFNL